MIAMPDTEVFIPESPEQRKGREFAHRMIHTCGELVDKGQTPEAVFLSFYAHHCITEFFAARGLPVPKDLCGIPVNVGQTGGREIVIRLKGKDVEH